MASCYTLALFANSMPTGGICAHCITVRMIKTLHQNFVFRRIIPLFEALFEGGQVGAE